MKKNNLTKALLLMLGAVALVCVSVFSTIAYLSESAAVSNTFTVGNVSIEMFESPVGTDGQIGANKTAYQNGTMKKTSDGNSYHLVPGTTFDKDPSVYVKADSEDCYIFIKVKNQIRPIEDGNILGTTEDNQNDAETMREQLIENDWVEIYKISADESLYVYTGTAQTLPEGDIAGVVEKSPTERKIDLFTTFTVDKKAEIGKLGGAKVTVTAFAIQGDINVGGEDAIADSCSLIEVQKLWNIVAGEFEFETFTIPADKFGQTDPTAQSANN